MMLPLSAIIVIAIAHFIADFPFQSDRVATGKSRCNKILGEHVLCYMSVLMIASVIIMGPLGGVYTAMNGALHFVTDYVTSRITSSLWKQDRRHDFFVMIGLDQLIHIVTLLSTLTLFIGK